MGPIRVLIERTMNNTFRNVRLSLEWSIEFLRRIPRALFQIRQKQGVFSIMPFRTPKCFRLRRAFGVSKTSAKILGGARNYINTICCNQKTFFNWNCFYSLNCILNCICILKVNAHKIPDFTIYIHFISLNHLIEY